MSLPCACGAPGVWVRDDDVVFCDACKEDDDTELVWWPLGERSDMDWDDQALEHVEIT